MCQYLRIGGRLEDTSPVFEVVRQFPRIDEVAVVCQGKVARMVAEYERLHGLDTSAAGSGVAYVPDRCTAFERRQIFLVEYLRYQSFAFDIGEYAVVTRYYAATLLPAMLQRVQAVVCEVGSILHAKYAENTALLV